MSVQKRHRQHSMAGMTSRKTRLASSLAIAIGLSTTSVAAFAANGWPQNDPRDAMQQQFDTVEAFRHIQAWHAKHPSPEPQATLGGATIAVTNCNDSGVGSFREAMENANSGDTIDMSGLSCSTISLSGLVVATGNPTTLTLQGAIVGGEPRPIITTSGDSPIINTASTELAIDALTIQGGEKYSSADKYGGGACVSASSIHISDSIITDCHSSGGDGAKGGAIAAEYDVYLTRSVVSDSTAIDNVDNDSDVAKGGAVYAGDHLGMKYSMVTGGTASTPVDGGFGGGIYAANSAHIKYSTIATSSAGTAGGGLQVGTPLVASTSSGNVTIDSSTISSNYAGKYAGVAISTREEVSIDSSTIAWNDCNDDGDLVCGLFINGGTGGTSPMPSISFTNNLISNNFNLSNGSYSDFDSQTGIVITGNHNLVGTYANANHSNLPGDTIAENVEFTALGDHGGPTWTRIPLRGWALNMGATANVEDQRGVDRPIGTADDIGAVETDALFLGRFEDPPLLN